MAVLVRGENYGHGVPSRALLASEMALSVRMRVSPLSFIDAATSAARPVQPMILPSS